MESLKVYAYRKFCRTSSGVCCSVITLEGSVRSSNSGANGLKQALLKMEQNRDKVNNREFLRLNDRVNRRSKIPLIVVTINKKSGTRKGTALKFVIYFYYFNLKITGMATQTLTGLSRCIAGFHFTFLIALTAA